MRRSGILLHISSLPGPGGIGSLGKEAREFADFLKAAGMSIWQVLPMGPTGYGESPYQSPSTYAGNPLYISLRTLREEGIVAYEDNEEYTPEDETQVNFEAVRANRELLLHRAFVQSEQKLKPEIDAFVARKAWLKDFALFMAVKQSFNNVMWSQWPDRAIRMREPEAVTQYTQKLDEEIRYHIFCQYLFDRQWTAFKAYCNGLGISLFGDMPIYVAEDSADTWTHPEVFQLDKDRVPIRVAGVPPDYFSADGQLWGNPLYRWDYLKANHYDWWVDRMTHMAEMYDIVRIDHFIGFANYFSIKHGAPNARDGVWIIGPGYELFRALEARVPNIHIIAEDLGSVNDRVKRLLKQVAYPGMKVLCFAFDAEDALTHRPESYTENCVAYTGTHDNNTIRGWLDHAEEEAVERAMKLLKFKKPEEASEAFLRAVMLSKADTAMAPMQDVLGLGQEGRMNLPGTIGGNWLWRLTPGAASPEVAERLLALVKESKRLPE